VVFINVVALGLLTLSAAQAANVKQDKEMMRRRKMFMVGLWLEINET
jgi:hypothetical protein